MAMIQVFRAVSMLAVFVEAVNMLQPAVLLSTFARLMRVLLRVELLSVRSRTLGRVVVC